MNIYDQLNARGYVYQLTDEDEIKKLLTDGEATFYVGIDPTADSLHVGHLLPLMVARWLQAAGHQPVIVIGGGTALVGDPSGKTEMRQMLSRADILANGKSLEKQVRKLFPESTPEPIMLDNIDWLEQLNYIEFLRDIGTHFSVNRMLATDSVKLRLESGLSFLEFNYMLLQSYDFYILARDRNCLLQIGGQDQWGNIVAGVDLVRRLTGKTALGLTFPLLTDRNGQKFGKTVEGAVWLDDAKTTIFDYYQFWRNVDDREVAKLLRFYTTLPLDEIDNLSQLPEPQINRAKEILAFEATALVHGEDKASEAYIAAGSQFGFADTESSIATSSAISEVNIEVTTSDQPTHMIAPADIKSGIWIVKLLVDSGLEKSNGAARRLIKGGGAYVNDERISDPDLAMQQSDFVDGALTLRSGKKNFRRIVIK